MFLYSMFVQGGIVFGVIILFIVTNFLNKKTPVPEGAELPEKCSSCVSSSCIVKLSKSDDLKKEIHEELNKLAHNCEESIDEKK